MKDFPGWSPEQALARRRIAIIVNGKSRRGRTLFKTACDGLEAAGFTITAAHALRNPRLLGPIIDRVIADGHDLIAIGGGDGTLAMAAAKLAGKPLLMAVLPFYPPGRIAFGGGEQHMPSWLVQEIATIYGEPELEAVSGETPST